MQASTPLVAAGLIALVVVISVCLTLGLRSYSDGALVRSPTTGGITSVEVWPARAFYETLSSGAVVPKMATMTEGGVVSRDTLSLTGLTPSVGAAFGTVSYAHQPTSDNGLRLIHLDGSSVLEWFSVDTSAETMNIAAAATYTSSGWTTQAMNESIITFDEFVLGVRQNETWSVPLGLSSPPASAPVLYLNYNTGTVDSVVGIAAFGRQIVAMLVPSATSWQGTCARLTLYAVDCEITSNDGSELVWTLTGEGIDFTPSTGNYTAFFARVDGGDACYKFTPTDADATSFTTDVNDSAFIDRSSIFTEGTGVRILYGLWVTGTTVFPTISGLGGTPTNYGNTSIIYSFTGAGTTSTSYVDMDRFIFTQAFSPRLRGAIANGGSWQSTISALSSSSGFDGAGPTHGGLTSSQNIGILQVSASAPRKLYSVYGAWGTDTLVPTTEETLDGSVPIHRSIGGYGNNPYNAPTPTESPTEEPTEEPTQEPDTPTPEPDTPTQEPDTPTPEPDTPTQEPETTTPSPSSSSSKLTLILGIVGAIIVVGLALGLGLGLGLHHKPTL